MQDKKPRVGRRTGRLGQGSRLDAQGSWLKAQGSSSTLHDDLLVARTWLERGARKIAHYWARLQCGCRLAALPGLRGPAANRNGRGVLGLSQQRRFVLLRPATSTGGAVALSQSAVESSAVQRVLCALQGGSTLPAQAPRRGMLQQ